MSEWIPNLTGDAGADLIVSPAEFTLAQGFASRMGLLAQRAGNNPVTVRWVERAAHAVSRATSEGHVCTDLATLLASRQDDFDSWRGSPAQARARLRALLLDSGLVCNGQGAAAALAPLVLDRDDRLYLARYYDYERQLARSLVQRAYAGLSDAHFGQYGADEKAHEVAQELVAEETLAAAALSEQLRGFFVAPEAGQIDWQRVAAVLALSGRLTVISGGPGTGKTTTVVAILACLLAQARQGELRIALAAPTGKAAQRMQEALLERADSLPPELAARLPRHSYTLHRLLGVGPGGRFRHHRDAPLPYDVIVIDEASMIDVALAARLVAAVPPTSRLILLGDKDQLAAVEAGAVFAELSAHPVLSAKRLASLAPALDLSAAQLAAALPPDRLPAHAPGAASSAPPLIDCVVWLERNYRFGLASPIGRLSLAIKQGAAADALAILAGHPESAALHEDGAPSLSDAALAQLAHPYLPYALAVREALAGPPGAPLDPAPWFEAFNRYRVLCAVRAGPRGVDALNLLLASRVRHVIAQGEALAPAMPAESGSYPASGAAAWYAGRPVMVTRNDYALGLFNGDIGIAVPVGPLLRVMFRHADGSYRAVSPAALPPHESAFALTVHKSQGSEFAQAALVLPAQANRVVTRELVYTAITRARERVAIYAAVEVLAQAIAARTERDSGLAARLADAVHERTHDSDRGG